MSFFKNNPIFGVMKVLKFFRRFSGKKHHYVPVFSQQATYLVHASEALYRMTDSTDPVRWRSGEKEVKACEIQGDALLTEFYEQLYEDILTAVNRSDMQSIAMDIDVFLDRINDSAKSILLYMPKKLDSHIRDLAQYINAEAISIRSMMPLLEDMKRNFGQISMLCDRITELEHAADDVFAEYISVIFTNEENAIDVMKYKNIAESMEAATDAAKKVSDTIRKILLRYID